MKYTSRLLFIFLGNEENLLKESIKEDIIRLALKKSISVYKKRIAEVGLHTGESTFWGVLPKAMVMKYGAGSKRKAGFVITEIWKAWYYSNEILKETDKLREPVKEPVSCMFFPEVWTEFMIHEEEQCLYLDCFFGPRNAVGYCFDIEVKENTAGLRKEQVLWVS